MFGQSAHHLISERDFLGVVLVKPDLRGLLERSSVILHRVEQFLYIA